MQLISDMSCFSPKRLIVSCKAYGMPDLKQTPGNRAHPILRHAAAELQAQADALALSSFRPLRQARPCIPCHTAAASPPPQRVRALPAARPRLARRTAAPLARQARCAGQRDLLQRQALQQRHALKHPTLLYVTSTKIYKGRVTLLATVYNRETPTEGGWLAHQPQQAGCCLCH